MKKIKKLMDHIAEEINDAEEYIRDAEACRENDSEVADTYCRLAEEELGHMNMLHKQVVRVIEVYRKTNGSPPAEMQARYEDERAANVALRNDISNFQQSQYILGQTGRWVAWLGSGSQPATGT